MRIIKASITLLLLITLNGCVTVTDSRFSKKSDPTKAADTYVALGVGYLGAGDLTLARKKIERALEIAPDSPSAHSAMAMYWEERGELKLAQKEFETALDIDDDHSPSNYHYGRYLLQHKRDPESCELIELAADDVDFKARVSAYEDLGICHATFNQASKAIDAFEKAWSLDMDSNISTLHLAELYYQRRSIRPAALWFKRFDEIVKAKNLTHSANSLYLGYRIAKAKRDRNAQASYAFKLKKRFPNSDEYKSFKRGK